MPDQPPRGSGREPQRAKVFLRLPDGGEQPVTGTAQIDGPWLNFWPDDPEWPASAFPASNVNAVEWEGDRDW